MENSTPCPTWPCGHIRTASNTVRGGTGWGGEPKTQCRECSATRNREWYRRNAEAKRQYERDRYDSLTGVEYNRRLLLRRRNKALMRMEKRNEAREQRKQ